MHKISIPKYVGDDRELISFLQLLDTCSNHNAILIDFQSSKFMIPGAVVGLLTKIAYWESLEKDVCLINAEKSKIYQYLQRIDFFNQCNRKTKENFKRRKPNKRFVPIKKIGVVYGKSGLTTDEISTRIAECISPEGQSYYEDYDFESEQDFTKTGLLDYIQYSVSEMTRNVNDHSKSFGFVSAQYIPETDIVEIGIADAGIGIKGSFRSSEYWNENLDDVAAIKKALEPHVSSKFVATGNGYSNNAGVGLTFLKMLSLKVSGNMSLYSGKGFVNISGHDYNYPNNLYNGTLCCISFKRSSVSHYSEILEQIKNDLGLNKIAGSKKGNFI